MKRIECPICGESYTKVESVYTHIDEEHEDVIPEGYTSARYAYLLRTGKDHGKCVICRRNTEWNDVTCKYKRFCENPRCKETYREQFKKRMIGKYGKETLLNDPEQQKKMLANRHISGEYIWSDGAKKTYTGSYEHDFLKMLDIFMNFDSSDIITPSPHTYYYMYEGEKKFYIPDAYIPSLNLEIEIKDGMSNPNTHHKIQQVDKVKERLKDAVMESLRDRDYIKIADKNYDEFFVYLINRKNKDMEAKDIKFNQGIVLTSESSTDCVIIDLESLPEPIIMDDIALEAISIPEKVSAIHLVLTQGKTPLISSGIRHFTKSEYTHASISFDKKLDKLYSFNFRLNKTGFFEESLKTFKDNTIAVYTFFVSSDKLEKMKAEINDFKENDTEYDFRILAIKMLNIDTAKIKDKYKQVCSTFVDTVLRSGGVNITKDINIAAPSDLYKSAMTLKNKVFNIYTGPADKYDYKKISRKLNYILHKSNTEIM